MRAFFACLALCVCLPAAALPQPAATRLRPGLSAAGVRYTDVRGAALDWSLGAGQPSVLIVLDPHRRLSRQLLDGLHRGGYDGARARVVVLGRDTAATVFTRLARHALPQAQWTFAAREDMDAHLVLAGVPVVLGLDTAHSVVWRASGLPRRPADLLLRIADWTAAAASPR
jgi:hypothetical protein